MQNLRYCQRLSIERGYANTYGFMSPYLIGSANAKSSENKLEEVQAYIQNKMDAENRRCYLAPYCYA